jgi:hypothetical protein
MSCQSSAAKPGNDENAHECGGKQTFQHIIIFVPVAK